MTAQNDNRETPLHPASYIGQVEVARTLIEHGADRMTAQNIDGSTPLHLASYWGRVDVARMLIEHGADVTAQKSEGETPLHLASKMGQGRHHSHAYCARRGCNSPKRRWGYPLTSMATVPSPVGPAFTTEICRSCSDKLLEQGADVNAENKNGLTSFVLASQGGLEEIICVLIQHGADSGAHDDAN